MHMHRIRARTMRGVRVEGSVGPACANDPTRWRTFGRQ